MTTKLYYTEALDQDDRREILSYCYTGIIFPSFLFLMTLAVSVIILSSGDSLLSIDNLNLIVYSVAPPVLLFSVWLGLFMTRKYRTDLKLNVKEINTETVKMKIQETQVTMTEDETTEQMKEPISSMTYFLVIGNSKIKVSKEVYSSTQQGENVNIHSAPVSGLRLKIVFSKNLVLY